VLIRYAFTEPSHPDGRAILSLLKSAKDVKLLPSSQRAGDYSVRTQHGQKVGFEYVNASGFYQDLVSERMDFKMAKLVEDYDVRLLIVSGKLGETHNGLTIVDGWRVHQFAWGSVERKLTRYGHTGVAVHMVDNPARAANLILRLSRSLEQRPLEGLKVKLGMPAPVQPLGHQDAQVRLLTMFPMLGGERARDVIAHYGTLREALIWMTSETEPNALAGVPGIGKGVSKAVKEFLDVESHAGRTE
jgi:ERCC4-type nuclease